MNDRQHVQCIFEYSNTQYHLNLNRITNWILIRICYLTCCEQSIEYWFEYAYTDNRLPLVVHSSLLFTCLISDNKKTRLYKTRYLSMSSNTREFWLAMSLWRNMITSTQSIYIPRSPCDPIETTSPRSVGGWRHPRNPCMVVMPSNGQQNPSSNPTPDPLSNYTRERQHSRRYYFPPIRVGWS